jgi:hypothetical protein
VGCDLFLRAFVLFVALAGCRHSSTSAPPEPIANHTSAAEPPEEAVPPTDYELPLVDYQWMMPAVKRLKDKMCDCHDARCAQGVSDEIARWAQDDSRHPGQLPPHRNGGELDEQLQEGGMVKAEMRMCLDEAMGRSTSP